MTHFPHFDHSIGPRSSLLDRDLDKLGSLRLSRHPSPWISSDSVQANVAECLRGVVTNILRKHETRLILRTSRTLVWVRSGREEFANELGRYVAAAWSR